MSARNPMTPTKLTRRSARFWQKINTHLVQRRPGFRPERVPNKTLFEIKH